MTIHVHAMRSTLTFESGETHLLRCSVKTSSFIPRDGGVCHEMNQIK